MTSRATTPPATPGSTVDEMVWICAVTYRMGFHNTTDNPSRYQDPAEYEEAKQRDPIERVLKYLGSLGLWSEERESALRTEVQAEVERAVEAAQALPGVKPEMLFDNVYSRLPARVQRQRNEFLQSLNGSGG